MFFETFTGKDDQFYFNLRTEEKVILKSEGYTTSSARDNGIESVKKNAPFEESYEADDNHFNLKAKNGQIVGSSVVFSTTEDLGTALVMTMKEAADAPIKERV